jgi:hypothetical protein
MSKNSYKDKKKVSPSSIIQVVVVVVLAVVIVGMVFCNVVFRSDNKAASIFGYSFYKTRAVNMVPEIPVNTVIIAKKSEIPNIKEKSVILCNIGDYTALTRVVEIQQEDDTTYYVVKFDTAPANETFRVSSDDVIAKAVWQLESFGKFLDFATSVPGIIIAIIIPLAIVVLMQLIRIRNIQELEKEADSIDDIDEVIFSEKKNEQPAFTFTEPKFTEDITDKIPLPAVGSHEEKKEEAPRPKTLTVDSNGRADYKVTEKSASESGTESAQEKFEKLGGFTQKQTVNVGAAARASGGNAPVASVHPTHIEPRSGSEYSDNTDENVKSGNDEQVVFTPHLSDIIPDSLVNIQDEAASSASRNSFDESVKAYFDKSVTVRSTEGSQNEQQEDTEDVNIPENAVIPKENIAPVKKKKSSKTLEELMNIIDAEETKLKK